MAKLGTRTNPIPTDYVFETRTPPRRRRTKQAASLPQTTRRAAQEPPSDVKKAGWPLNRDLPDRKCKPSMANNDYWILAEWRRVTGNQTPTPVEGPLMPAAEVECLTSALGRKPQGLTIQARRY